MSKEEHGRFEILMLLMFRMINSQYRQHMNGGADEEYWEPSENNARKSQNARRLCVLAAPFLEALLSARFWHCMSDLNDYV